jgi:hypothetical protein
MRTGRQIDWTQLRLKVFGAPLVFAPIDGPIHKRAPINEEGYSLRYQWPAMLVLRKRDGKVISVSRQKVRVYESAYTGPLDERMIANKIESEFVSNDVASSDDTDEKVSKESTVFDGKTLVRVRVHVQSLMERLFNPLSHFAITNLNCRGGTTKMRPTLRSQQVLEMWRLFEKGSILMMFYLLLWVSLLGDWKRTRGADSHSRKL